MSDMILGKQGVDPKVIALATQIKAAQGPEIQQMQGWLTQWGRYRDVPPSSGMPGMPGMPGTSGMPGMPGMPGMQPGQGMMSEQDMAALQNAQGVTASKLFLTQMIAHHQGGPSPWPRPRSRRVNRRTRSPWPTASRPASNVKSTP